MITQKHNKIAGRTRMWRGNACQVTGPTTTWEMKMDTRGTQTDLVTDRNIADCLMELKSSPEFQDLTYRVSLITRIRRVADNARSSAREATLIST